MACACRNTDHGAADVRPALEATLQDLHVSYLDLYLVRPLHHLPCYAWATGTVHLHVDHMQGLCMLIVGQQRCLHA